MQPPFGDVRLRRVQPLYQLQVQAVLRVVVTGGLFTVPMYDWPDHLPACQLALNNRTSTVMGMSANRALHGYDFLVDKLTQGRPEVSHPIQPTIRDDLLI
ncbi:uncharacterized protein CPUR_08244 [Claviceps purpurea 20.1]|uniref:Uncharacterized protein n=1 Tax=Claviceps purpurea (strain 20.1) TaxID=1111077 RepID=M1VYR6_CLAP2|nr:uncharacterized protein CPUR_08244 [Claviceps purpurea 20.1]